MAEAAQQDHYEPRLKARYDSEIAGKLREEFQIENVMATPKLEKIVVNIGLGQATQNIKLLDAAVEELTQVTGQKPVVTRGEEVDRSVQAPRGTADRLSGDPAWSPDVGLPRPTDRDRVAAGSRLPGVPTNSFDGRGNYTLGVRDLLIFPDLDYNSVETPKGMNITFVTQSANDERAFYLLRELGMPFRRDN